MPSLSLQTQQPLGAFPETEVFKLSVSHEVRQEGPALAMEQERLRILDALLRNAPLHGAIQEKLGKVVSAAVAWPGGLLRYHLAQLAALAFGAEDAASESLACAAEYFHIASLLLDDLPQMDDSMERRGRICPHLLYGEDMVILGALALITRAYALLGTAVSGAPAERHLSAHALIERCLGTCGILNGQARDLNFRRGQCGRMEATSIALQKTAPLIGLALLLPALLGGADARTLLRLRRLSVYWGLFYQGVDDFKDILENSSTSGKTSGRDENLGRPNIALEVGMKKAERHLHRLCRLAQRCVGDLIVEHPRLEFLALFQWELRMRWEALES